MTHPTPAPFAAHSDRYDLPLILRLPDFGYCALYDPLLAVSDYVRALNQIGFPADRIPSAYRYLAAMETYVGNVEGNGHIELLSVFGDDLQTLLDDAIEGCRMLNIERTIPIIQECAALFRGLTEADLNDELGEAFTKLDKRLFEIKLTDIEFEDFLASCPEGAREALRQAGKSKHRAHTREHYVKGFAWVAAHPSIHRVQNHGPQYAEDVATLLA